MTQVEIQQLLQNAGAHEMAGRWGAAESIYRQILSWVPDEPSALYGLGRIAARAKHPDGVSLLTRLASAVPNVWHVQNTLGAALQSQGQIDEAIGCYLKATQLDSSQAEPYNNFGICLTLKDRFEEAVTACKQAISLRPEFPEAHNNLALALLQLGRFEEAVDSYRRAIALRPEYARAHYYLGMALLTLGQFEEGWKEYEWRWLAPDVPTPRRSFKQPVWDGSMPSPERTTILLYGEQGFGDEIQFVRHCPEVARRGWRVVVECQRSVLRLLEMSTNLGITSLVERLPSGAAPAVEFDVHAPLASLPRILGGIDPNRCRDVWSPYLVVDLALRNVWQARTAHIPPGMKIGLCWSGSPAHRNDRNRSIPLAKLAPLVGAVRGQGWSFFSFQMGAGAAQLKTPPAGMDIVDLTGRITDWADSAALAMEMDLIIAVDTAMAHLAGALGKPVWVLLPFVPDFRWMLDREDSPLYPSMRLFRQKTRGDWDEPIGRVATELSRLVAAARPGQDGPP